MPKYRRSGTPISSSEESGRKSSSSTGSEEILLFKGARQKLQQKFKFPGRRRRHEALNAATAQTSPSLPSLQQISSDNISSSGCSSQSLFDSGCSFFSSASNLGISGGQFSVDSSNNYHTNLTIHFHHGHDPARSSDDHSSLESDTSLPIPDDLGNRACNIINPPLPWSPLSSSSKQPAVTQGVDSAMQSQDQRKSSQGAQILATTATGAVATPAVITPAHDTIAPLSSWQKSSDVYYSHLSVKQRGFPLWIPEPNCYLPIQYQRKGISIGDVGIITAAGSFDYLFNVLLRHDHPFNVGRVPPGFTPLSPPLDPGDIRGHLEIRSNSVMASSTVRRGLGCSDNLGTTFHISAPEGAILTIPDGALTEDLGNLVPLRRYMGANIESWYRYANGPRGRGLANGDLRLVIGCDKTTAWGVAACANISQGEDTVLRFKPVGASQFQTYEWELHSGMADARSGPDMREIRALSVDDAERGGEPQPYENHCIFVRTLNATLHDTAWLELMAKLSVPGGSAGSRFLTPTVPTNSHAANRSLFADSINDRVIVHKPEVPAYFTSHPSKSLNAAILQQYEDAKVVITDDSDWGSVLRKNDIVMPKARHLTERILASSSPVRDATGVIYLERTGPLQRGSLIRRPEGKALRLVAMDRFVDKSKTQRHESQKDKNWEEDKGENVQSTSRLAKTQDSLHAHLRDLHMSTSTGRSAHTPVAGWRTSGMSRAPSSAASSDDEFLLPRLYASMKRLLLGAVLLGALSKAELKRKALLREREREQQLSKAQSRDHDRAPVRIPLAYRGITPRQPTDSYPEAT